MLATIRKIAGLSAIYSVGDIITKGISFLLLPLYTHFLTTDDYGIIAMVSMISTILSLLTSFGMSGAVFHFYYLFKEAHRKQFYGAIWVFLLLCSGCIFLILSLFGKIIFEIFFHQIPFYPYIQLTLWTVFVNVAFALLPPALFRAREQASRYVLFNFITFSATTLLTIWFVVFEKQGAVGIVTAQFIAAFITAIVSVIVLLKDTTPNFHFIQTKSAIMYGVPLIPHLLAHWILSLSDRAILERYVSLGEIGIYSLGYQFGIMYQMIATSINNALLPIFSRAAKSEADLQSIPQIVTYYILVLTIIALTIALLAKDIITLILPVSYHSSGKIIPWVILGYFAMGIYYIPTNILAMTAGKTNSIPIATTVAAIVNIILNMFFVPIAGILAAAINTAVGYSILASIMFFLAQHEKMLDYEYERIGKIVLSGSILFFLGQLLMCFSAPINLGIGVILIILSPVMLKLLGFWTEQESRYLLKLRQHLLLSFNALR